MTMRISIDIVPHGVEENLYKIFRIDVSNLGDIANLGFGNVICKYRAQLYRHNNETERRLLNSEEWEKEGPEFFLEHNRRDGAVPLAQKVLNLYEETW